MNHYYVYGYSDPTSSDPFFYIGKGHGDRYLDHFQWNLLKQQTHFYNRLRSLLLKDILPNVIFLKSALSEYEAFNFEIESIAKYGRLDLGTGCLCNHTNGGDGASGHICSLETRKLIGLKSIGNQNTKGFKFDFDSSIKRSIAGNNRSPEIKEAISQKIIKTKGRQVVAINPISGNIVLTFSSIGDVRKKGISPSGVSNVLAGYKKSAGGYFWRYLEN